MSQGDDPDAILQQIEDGQQAEENLAALREILHGGRRREVLQKLAQYDLHIQEVAGGDLQIGDRIYNGWTEQAFEALLLAMRSQIAELLQAQSSKTDVNADQEIADFGEMPPCPYQGLSAFQEENAEFFFGREAFIEDVVREDGGVRQGLVNAVKTKPLVAVVGASGSGKSSLVFAGLLPQLAQETGWLICKLRPGYPDKRSFHNLAAALLSLKAPEPNVDPLVLLSQRAKALQDGTVTLQDVVAEMLRQTPTTRCLLLVIDQFEELFTLCAEEERQPLLDVLLAGVKDVPGLKIVLTLRADFCGQAYAYRPLADALHEADLKLGPMNREELRSAIERPATKKVVQLEAGLVDRILDEVGQEPGNLPLLEVALTQLWAKPRQGQLTHEAYTEIGGVAKDYGFNKTGNHSDCGLAV
ncbi:MAG: ATP-binding protein [Stenomitos rutilans HA7619-LM2]|jgi:energy-coupling factor transporter ATP-binding protein EcfA2|nr:ATP-binding protein [Stenomitos rutilans HA7619-LM2]